MPATPTTHLLPPTNIFRPVQPTPLQRFLSSPLTLLITHLYTHQPPPSSSFPNPPPTNPLRIVCLSDTHTTQPVLPPGDILIHAGDLTQNGTFAELQRQISWLNAQPHAHKVVVAGNHDVLLDDAFVARAKSRSSEEFGKTRADLEWGDVIYLEESMVTLRVRGRQVKIWGSPWTPRYGNWAFQYAPTEGLDVWAGKIPRDADVVVTHGPARGHLDGTVGVRYAGCKHLGRELGCVKPRLVVCGHVHEARGKEEVCWDAVQRMYDAAVGGEVGGWYVVVGVVGVAAWVWKWVGWAFGVRSDARSTLVNASTVGHWGVAEGIVVEY